MDYLLRKSKRSDTHKLLELIREFSKVVDVYIHISNKQLKSKFKNSFIIFLIGYLEISLTEDRQDRSNWPLSSLNSVTQLSTFYNPSQDYLTEENKRDREIREEGTWERGEGGRT